MLPLHRFFLIACALLVAGCASSAPTAMRPAQQAPPPLAVQPVPEPPPVPAAVEPDEPLPIPLVVLKGTPEEMGRAHGEQLSDRIHTLEEKYLNVRLGDVKRRFFAMTLAAAFEPLFDPAHRAETHALAAGAGMNPRVALLAQCFLDLTSSVACSTVALPAEASPDGVARMGRNLDFPSLNVADKMSVVIVYQPADSSRFRFVAIGWPGLVGVLTGMNEHGLTLANMEVARPPRYPSAMPYTLLYRTVLEKCRTVDEAVALLERSGRQSANNLMLMDADGSRAVVELTPEAVKVRRGIAGAALVSTNHQRDQDTTTPGECRRYDFLTETTKRDFGDIGVNEIEKMLAGASQGKFTLQSMVFEPKTRVMYLATGANAATQKFYRADLKQHFQR